MCCKTCCKNECDRVNLRKKDMGKLIELILNWLFPEQDERKASTRYQQADKAEREQFELIQNNDFTV